MREGFHRRLAQAAALVDGVMRQGVVYDQVILAAEVAHEGHVGGVSSHEHQGGLRVLPCRQLGLQLDVQALFTGQQAAAGGRCAVLVDRGLGGIHGFLAAAHARVVIAAEVQHPLAVHQAGVGQRRVMHHKIGVLHPAAHQGLMALREGNGLG
ncbi:hypothetical protein SDC9_181899 [bioreactor metagenome]|uniref:Uncharacterized protein n=1 Tax=bioreactor metagenome TaxID=1076179 RepID=A0A645H7D2_9ZZZZ